GTGTGTARGRASAADRGIWVSWTRKRADGNGEQRPFQVAYRQKSGVDDIESGWNSIRVLPKDPPDALYHDCEPAAVVNENSDIELFWTSNRTGTWSGWKIELENIIASQLDTAEMLIDNPYSQRTPLPLRIDNKISVIYRSNKSISYQSDVYGATETTDFRYAGSTTADVRNKAKIELRGTFEDFQTY
ncbi:MAG: hypothetical protein GY940_21860, partial [bacterium]|nr:hypothetical protein [bacterium]